MLDAAFSLEFPAKREYVPLVGPAGVGKSFQALGYAAVRAGHTVRFSHADGYFTVMAQALVDKSLERSFRSFLSPGLLTWTTWACAASPPSRPLTSTS